VKKREKNIVIVQ